MFNRLPRISLAPQQKRIRSLWSPQSQLIQRNNLPSSLFNSLPCSPRDSQSSNAQFGNLQHSHIIGDGADHDDGFISGLGRAGDLTSDEGDWLGGPVDARLEETFEDCFVEFGVGATGEETVEFYEEEEVDIFWGGSLTVSLADMVSFWEVNTLFISIWLYIRRED